MSTSPACLPVQVPKKTRLYLEQTKRETEQAVDMHRIFQRDLAKLKLTAARTYVKLLTDGKVRCMERAPFGQNNAHSCTCAHASTHAHAHTYT